MPQIFHLTSSTCSLVLLNQDRRLPEILYWNAKLDLDKSEWDQILHSHKPPVPQGHLDEAPALTLLPTLGEGVFDCHALSGHRGGRDWAPQFTLLTIDGNEHNHLLVVAQDSIAQIQVTIELRLNAWNLLEKSIQLKNVGSGDYSLENLGLTLVLPESISEITQFHGRWLHEFQTQRSSWDQPNYLVENLKGRTSHDNPSLLMLGEPGYSEQSGVVYAFHLAWSGNHYYKMMTLDDGRRVVQFGEKLLPGEILLRPGECYQSPTLYASFSQHGSNQVSANFHQFIRESKRLAARGLAYRPVHFNTWEALYFDHDLGKLQRLIERAAEMGVERFILDDGWFRGRNHDRAGLGDWSVDSHKYPQGLAPVMEQVLNRGMQFGLWVEPEMVNPDSDLYRAHPEWVLHLEGYRQPLGRSQYALNLAHPGAYQHIHACLHSLLSQYRISYLKWDMNRDLVQPGALHSRPGVHQQVHSLYRLLEQLRSEFPDLEIESCASGGGRADLGILAYTHRFWTSDCNDPLERQKIQRGFSYFFPPELMGSHVGPEQAHTTNRRAALEYRLITSLFGHLGLELNLLELSAVERDTIQHYIRLYKEHRDWIHSGKYVRLQDQRNGQHGCGVIRQDCTQGMFQVAQQEFPKYRVPARLRLPFFPPASKYQVQLLNQPENAGCLMKQEPTLSRKSLRMSGNLLAQVGIQLPVMHPQSALLLRVDQLAEDEPCI